MSFECLSGRLISSKMKLKFWKKSNKSQAKRKCCRKASDVVERENLRTTVEGECIVFHSGTDVFAEAVL